MSAEAWRPPGADDSVDAVSVFAHVDAAKAKMARQLGEVIRMDRSPGGESFQWMCGLCAHRARASGMLGAYVDAVEHLNGEHAATLIGDGK